MTPVSFTLIRPEKPALSVRKKNDVVWLESPLFRGYDEIIHGFTTRLGGVSSGYLSSMNLSFASEREHPEHVRENFRRLAESVGFDASSLVFSSQMHTTNVIKVGRGDTGCGTLREYGFHDVDGFITDEPGVTPAVFSADCVPVLFFDPVHRAVGAAHSGWRGTAAGIVRVLVSRMTEAFGSDPSDLLVTVGPAICRRCYEVSEEVAVQFPSSCLEAKPDGKYQLDLHRANELLLLDSGILPGHLFLSNLCTSCNKELLFSHRATGGRRGLTAGFIGLRQAPFKKSVRAGTEMHRGYA